MQRLDPGEDLDRSLALKIYGSSRQGLYGDNKSERPGFGSGFAAKYKWDAWEELKGWSLTKARKEFIKLTEPELIRLGIDMRDPKEPGPDYYEGCYVEEEVEVEEGSDSSEIKDSDTTTVQKELVFAVVDEEEEEEEEELTPLDQSELQQTSAIFFNQAVAVSTITAFIILVQ